MREGKPQVLTQTQDASQLAQVCSEAPSPAQTGWGRHTSSSSLSSCTVGVCVFSWMFETASPCTLNFSAAASWACWDRSSIWRRKEALSEASPAQWDVSSQAQRATAVLPMLQQCQYIERLCHTTQSGSRPLAQTPGLPTSRGGGGGGGGRHTAAGTSRWQPQHTCGKEEPQLSGLPPRCCKHRLMWLPDTTQCQLTFASPKTM